MTKIVQRRCKYCQIIYAHKLSGSRTMGRKYSTNEDYCLECYEIMQTALKERGIVKREKVWEKTDEITYEELLREQAEQREKRKGTMISILTRMCVPLMNNEMTQEVISDRVEIDRKEYSYSFRRDIKTKKLTTEIEIHVAMEKDLIENKIIGYWRDI